MKNNIEQNGFEMFFDYQNRNTHSRINKNPRKRNMMDNSFASSSFSSSSQLSSQVVNNAFPNNFRFQSSDPGDKFWKIISFEIASIFQLQQANFNYGPPLDYSFRNISSLERGLGRNRAPRQSLRKQRRSPSGRYYMHT